MEVIRQLLRDDRLQEELHLVHGEVRHDEGDMVAGGDGGEDGPE